MRVILRKMLPAVMAVAALLAGCGYHIAGMGGKMPGGIKTLAMPVFVNATAKPDIEASFTGAFVNEFVTSVEVVREGEAEMKGVIKSYALTPVSYTKSDVNQEYRLTVALSVRIVREEDGETRVLWEDDNITDFEDFTVNINDVTATKDREAEALKKIARDLARLTKERVIEAF